MKPQVVFTSFANRLYGTERICLAIAEGLQPEFDICVLSPPGAFQEECRRLGIEAHPFESKKEFVRLVRRLMSARREFAFLSMNIWHVPVVGLLGALLRRKVAQLHLVHGGSTEKDSYSRKHYLNALRTRYVTPSEFVRERLGAYRVPASRVVVVPNFLAPSFRAMVRPRPPFEADGIRSVVIVCRVDPIKRVDLLMDVLDRYPEFADLPIRIIGDGPLMPQMTARGAKHPNVTFTGVVPAAEVLREMGNADLLLHLCPEEPFGLVILEAMATHLPVLGPDQGGVASIIEDGRNGFSFRANDVESIAAALRTLRTAPAAELNRVVAAAARDLDTTYSYERCVGMYRDLIVQGLR